MKEHVHTHGHARCRTPYESQICAWATATGSIAVGETSAPEQRGQCTRMRREGQGCTQQVVLLALRAGLLQ